MKKWILKKEDKIRNIDTQTLTTESLVKTTTQKVKRYEELKKLN